MSKTTQSRETTLAGHPVEYEVRRSEDATEPRIDIDIRGVTVVLPQNRGIPEALLSENLNWVLETKRTYERHRERAPERRFEPGAAFPTSATTTRSSSSHDRPTASVTARSDSDRAPSTSRLSSASSKTSTDPEHGSI